MGIREGSSVDAKGGFSFGAIHLSDGFDAEHPAGVNDAATIKRPFDVVDAEVGEGCKVEEGVVFVGSRETVEVDGIDISASFRGSVYLVVSWSTSGFEGELTTTEPSSSDDMVSRKLYDFEDGKPTMDYRCAPVFVLYN